MDEGQPPTRNKPDFHVIVHTFGKPAVEITEAIMDVYDIAVNSMDMGSGFLDDEEVGNLRTLGKVIGAEHFDYQSDKCLSCGHFYDKHNRTYDGVGSCNIGRWGVDTDPCKCKGFVSPYKNEGVN